MRIPARRLVSLAALAGVAALAVAAVQAAEGDEHYLPVERSTCWECHSGWDPPMEAIAVAIPTGTVEADVGQPFDYKVQIQNTWRADVPFLSPTLDISNAPSLRFAGGHAPDSNRTTLSITPNPSNLTVEQGASTAYYVPQGVTALAFGADPQNKDSATGPDIRLTIVSPLGEQLPVQDEAGPGGAELRTLTTDELLRYGSGTWRVRVSFVPFASDASPPRPPILGRQAVDVTEEARFETATLRSLAFPHVEFLAPAGSTLQTWELVASAPPAAGETVRIYANVTGHYDHDTPVATGDWGNFTTGVEAKVVDGATMGKPGKVLLVFESTVTRPAILNGPTWARISEAIGYAAAFLMLSSILSGGMFGSASRRAFNHLFGNAKRRVAFHNFLSYGLTVAAIAHTVIFVGRISTAYDWTWGLTFGGLAILSMFGLGVTGALQVPMIRKWNFGTWRWTHYGLTVTAIVFTVVHMLLDGANFGKLQEELQWKYQLFPFRDPSAV